MRGGVKKCMSGGTRWCVRCCKRERERECVCVCVTRELGTIDALRKGRRGG